MSVPIYKPVATAITCREDDEDAMVMLGAYRELERENAALKIERNHYKIALQDIAEASGGWAKRRAQVALKKENQS